MPRPGGASRILSRGRLFDAPDAAPLRCPSRDAVAVTGALLDVFSQQRGWWGYHWAAPQPLSITRIIASGSLDAELAALLWLLIEGRVPVVVAAEAPLAGKTTTLTALMDFLPPGVRKLFLRGWTEDFSWLPDAASLGWPGWRAASALEREEWADPGDPRSWIRRPGARRLLAEETVGRRPTPPADPARTYLLASELSSHLPVYTWGLHARVLIRSLQRGYGLGTSLHADSLEEVFEQLQAPPVSATEDEIRMLGVVIILRLFGPRGQVLNYPEGSLEAELGPLQPSVRRRAVAVHYLRPVERDRKGHLQRRPPAILATWERERDCFEHFAWAITPELALRVGRSQAEFEKEHAARTDYLSRLVTSGITGIMDVRRAIDGYRGAVPGRQEH